MTKLNEFATSVDRNATDQSNPIRGRESEMVENNAGGYVFKVDDLQMLDRFLILGTEKNTYYVNASTLTKNCAENVTKIIAKYGPTAVDRIVEISHSGRAPKNNQALFALALAASDDRVDTRTHALNSLPKVARTASDLFQFLSYVTKFRGWGSALRRAVANWYVTKEPESLAYQMVKYQSRFDWSHRDVLRVSHPKTFNDELNNVLRWGVSQDKMNLEVDSKFITAFQELHAADSVDRVVNIINTYDNVPREAIPTQWLSEAKVWDALLMKGMPITALLRNLANLGKHDLLKPFSEGAKIVNSTLTNQEVLHRGRVHPMQVMMAKTMYEARFNRSSRWEVNKTIVDSLEDAFYESFKNVEPTGKNILIALDVSGSMGCYTINDIPGFTPRVASAVMAMLTLRTEENCIIKGFSHKLVDVPLQKKMSIDQVIKTMNSIPMGGTDCALPALWCTDNRIDVDGISIYTDNETWYGQVHPTQALANLRKKLNKPDIRQAVNGMTATNFSIADTKDPLQLDVVGMDSAAPQLIADFFRG